jgi:hypothetical protein
MNPFAVVMTVLDPATSALSVEDARVKPAHDGV